MPKSPKFADQYRVHLCVPLSKVHEDPARNSGHLIFLRPYELTTKGYALGTTPHLVFSQEPLRRNMKIEPSGKNFTNPAEELLKRFSEHEIDQILLKVKQIADNQGK